MMRLRSILARHSVPLGAMLAGCGEPGAPVPEVVSDPQPLGASCRRDDDCISRLCLESQYGTPFCSRPCTTAWEPCAEGDDAGEGQALCVSFESPPNPDAPGFEGELSRFCVPRCQNVGECTSLAPIWETCDVPKWLGDPLFPGLGGVKTCQSPSFHGKALVDPSVCDWERTVAPEFNNEANLCRAYCGYLDRCKALESGTETACCEWGCYNRIVIEDEVVDPWRDEIRCLIETHAAYPDEGPRNACTEPPKECGVDPVDPTPPAASD
jgi:hypothetical protein